LDFRVHLSDWPMSLTCHSCVALIDSSGNWYMARSYSCTRRYHLCERRPSERDVGVASALYQMAPRLLSISCFDLARSISSWRYFSFLAVRSGSPAAAVVHCSYRWQSPNANQHAHCRTLRPGPRPLMAFQLVMRMIRKCHLSVRRHSCCNLLQSPTCSR
jgi:hypothetical protein